MVEASRDALMRLAVEMEGAAIAQVCYEYSACRARLCAPFPTTRRMFAAAATFANFLTEIAAPTRLGFWRGFCGRGSVAAQPLLR